MKTYYAVCLLLAFIVALVSCSDADDNSRNEKLISTFQIIKFPNDVCKGSTTRNGTCYTSQECSHKGGTSSGSCADGFGVCCIFVISTCGKSSSENITAWTQPTTVSNGVCSLDVMPLSDDICSLRIDFKTFDITGPSTITIQQGRRRLGTSSYLYANTNSGDGVNWSTNCHTDAFYVQGPSPSSNPPLVCGLLTGEHMYVEADIDRGNRMFFAISDITVQTTTSRGVGTAGGRTWDMTISQIECNSLTLPPAGCTKYFWNAAGSATLTNYNWRTKVELAGVHLAQQHERMCIRRERGKCVGCFVATSNANFAVSNAKEGAGHSTAPYGCCGYASNVAFAIVAIDNKGSDFNGLGTGAYGQFGWDCIIIPGAFTVSNKDDYTVATTQATTSLQQAIGEHPTTADMAVPQGPQICGSGKGIGPGIVKLDSSIQSTTAGTVLAATAGATSLSVCTRSYPFMLEFMSDDLEGQGSSTIDTEFISSTQAHNQGFQLAFAQLAC